MLNLFQTNNDLTQRALHAAFAQLDPSDRATIANDRSWTLRASEAATAGVRFNAEGRRLLFHPSPQHFPTRQQREIEGQALKALQELAASIRNERPIVAKKPKSATGAGFPKIESQRQERTE
ncbi:MAG: hypothetical protein NXI32_26980 [bacterium]|nr:hypothetical protein [bacterium]